MISYKEQKDQWYEHYYSLALDERYAMFLNLLDQGVSSNELIEDDIGIQAVDLKSDLIA